MPGVCDKCGAKDGAIGIKDHEGEFVPCMNVSVGDNIDYYGIKRNVFKVTLTTTKKTTLCQECK